MESLAGAYKTETDLWHVRHVKYLCAAQRSTSKMIQCEYCEKHIPFHLMLAIRQSNLFLRLIFFHHRSFVCSFVSFLACRTLSVVCATDIKRMLDTQTVREH